MSIDDRTAQATLTPEERREMLRAFADRMLLKVSNMDDPEDLQGVERAMRVAAVIERVYSRCDRTERQIGDKTPDPSKLEAERAIHETAAIKARVSLANTLKWGEERRRDLGQWWEAAQNITNPASQAQTSAPQTATASGPKVFYTDLTDDIEAARAELALRKRARRNRRKSPFPPCAARLSGQVRQVEFATSSTSPLPAQRGEPGGRCRREPSIATATGGARSLRGISSADTSPSPDDLRLRLARRPLPSLRGEGESA